MTPTLPSIDLPKKPQYIKISHRLETIDIFALFSIIEKYHDDCYLLESLANDSYQSRYAVIGFGADSQIWAKGHLLWVDGEKFEIRNPYFALRQIIPQDIISRNYAGGLVGYLAYESVNYFEEHLNLKSSPFFDDFRFGVYSDGLVYDTFTGELYYFYYRNNRLQLVKRYLHQLSDQPITPSDTKVEFLGHSLSREQHSEQVASVLSQIRQGNTFQCEVGFKSHYRIKGNAINIYQQLRQMNPSPHMFYVKFGRQILLGASPELLFRLQDGEMETFPLAGTARRGLNVVQDREFTRELLNDAKEIAEHLMLVDMHRNDLGKVARFATVKVRKLMDIVKFSHVQHISSEITGILRQDKDMFDGLASLLPGGVLNGAPKVESMKIIARNEREPRGPYGGALGHFGFNGNCTFCIPIRSLFIYDEQAYAQTCSGIVYDSVAEKEYREIISKLEAMDTVLRRFC